MLKLILISLLLFSTYAIAYIEIEKGHKEPVTQILELPINQLELHKQRLEAFSNIPAPGQHK